jgi:hypothetical protein
MRLEYDEGDDDEMNDNDADIDFMSNSNIRSNNDSSD